MVYFVSKKKEDHPLRAVKMGFTSTVVRHKFFRNVYAIYAVCLALTVGVMLINLIKPVREVFYEYWYTGLVALVSCIGLALLPVCTEKAIRKYPYNLILLMFLHALFGLAFAILVSKEKGNDPAKVLTVPEASFICLTVLVMCFALFALQTKYDITELKGKLGLALINVLILGGFWTLIGIYFLKDTTNYIYDPLFAFILVPYFISVLMGKTQRVMEGNHPYAISPEEFDAGAVVILLVR